MPLSFTYTLAGRGCRQATLAQDGTAFSLRASYLSDTLRDLTDAIIALMRGASHASCAWQNEDDRREYRWLFDQHAGEVAIAIVAFEDLFSRQADEQGVVVFTTRCPRLRLAGQVLTQLWRLLNDVGLTDYKERWVHHAFPLAEYMTLQELIRLETGGRRPAGDG